ALTVSTEYGTWSALPEGTSGVPVLDEREWERQLGLPTASAPQCSLDEVAFLSDWTAGVVYVFGGALLSHRLNLGLFCDRVEVDFLLTERRSGGRVLRAHRLEADGSLTVWRVRG
ncbi:hypothetical protein, partial [Deinococcus sp.]|uniref:hypothetical protein n=1 Tax=Deinococcus sp. TaxID=47478 RepID=UPI002869B047